MKNEINEIVKNEIQSNGNKLAGNFNINANGKTETGYQTLDKVDWLKANYGNSYGKSIDSDAVTSTKNAALPTFSVCLAARSILIS